MQEAEEKVRGKKRLGAISKADARVTGGVDCTSGVLTVVKQQP